VLILKESIIDLDAWSR